jgi:Putative DNA-binding domain
MDKSPHAQFVQSLLNPYQALPLQLLHPKSYALTPHKRFAIYQNNVLHSLCEALKARFPVVFKLVGEDFFKGLSINYARENPPTSRLMWQYGESFASFIAQFPPAAALPYLSDVARLEASLAPVFHARDEEALSIEAFQTLLSQDIGGVKFQFAKAFALVKSDYPIFSLWQMNQEGQEPHSVSLETAQAALVYRVNYAVDLLPVELSTFHLLATLENGENLQNALQITQFNPENLGAFFTLLLQTQLITGVL